MIKIGILGDIGSGKSFVAKQFSCPVFNADNEVKKIYKNDKICFKKLKKILPNFISSFPVKKKELFSAILSKENNLKKIVKVVHPIVKTKMKKFFLNNKNKKIIVLDIPLLLENKLEKKNYILVFVDAKKKDIVRNLVRRKNYNYKVFDRLKKIQLPLEFKKKKSNYIIKNDFKSHRVKKSVNLLKNKILNK